MTHPTSSADEPSPGEGSSPLDDSTPLVVLVCADLMLTSVLCGAAAVLGLQFRRMSSLAQGVALLRHFSAGRLFVDLGTPGLRMENLTSEIPEDIRRRAVAYGPHVHENLLNAARAAGFGQVMSRGQFQAHHQELLMQMKIA